MKRFLGLFFSILLMSVSAAFAQDTALPQYSTLYALQWSPDGTKLLAGEKSGLVIVWDAFTGAELHRFEGHKAELFDGARGRWSPDGTRLVSWSADHTARIWDAVSGDLLQTLAGHSDDIQTVEWSPDGTRLVSISADTTARVWDAESGVQQVAFDKHTAALQDVEWSFDGTQIVTAADDATARLWDATTGEEVFVFAEREPTDIQMMTSSVITVYGVEWSPDGTRISVTATDGAAMVWDAITGERLGVMRTSTRSELLGHFIIDAYWSTDGTRLILHAVDFPPTVWDTNTGVFLYALQGHRDLVTRTRWSADGSEIMTSGVDGTIRFWDAETGVPLRVIDTRATLWSAEYSPDGFLVASTADNGTIRLWDPQSGREQAFIFPAIAQNAPAQVTNVRGDANAELDLTLAPMITQMADFISDQGEASIGENANLISTGTVMWTYSGTANETISLALDVTDFRPHLRVLAADDTIIAEIDGSSLTATLPSDGHYRIEISSLDPMEQYQMIPYILSLTSSRVTATATPGS